MACFIRRRWLLSHLNKKDPSRQRKFSPPSHTHLSPCWLQTPEFLYFFLLCISFPYSLFGKIKSYCFGPFKTVYSIYLVYWYYYMHKIRGETVELTVSLGLGSPHFILETFCCGTYALLTYYRQDSS